MPNAAEFSLAFHGIMPDRTLTAVRHFLHWPSLGSQPDRVPRRPLLASTTAEYAAFPPISLVAVLTCASLNLPEIKPAVVEVGKE
jgi:hypothetical protein